MATISTKMQDALNEHINQEMYSGHLYLAMAAYCESINLRGFAHWLRVQYQEELGHALKLYDYVHDRGGRVRLKAVEAPPPEFDGALAVFEQALEHERGVTAKINALYALAGEERDYATQSQLQWFIDEQVEEEKNAAEIVERIKMAGERGHYLLWLDKELGKRAAG